MTSIQKAALGCVFLSILSSACLSRTVTIPSQTPNPGASAVRAHNPAALWEELFDGNSLTWIAPLGHSPRQVANVYSMVHEPALSYLHALHDARPGSTHPAPAVHIGMQFDEAQLPLDRIGPLRWRWRVLKHPTVTDDAWLDMAASLYVIVETPSLWKGGKGFKLGWLAKPGAEGTFQRGLAQIELRHDPASSEWREESVDLCALYRKIYGPCEGQHLLFVGVVTDADGTHSIAEGDYADFELIKGGSSVAGAARGSNGEANR